MAACCGDDCSGSCACDANVGGAASESPHESVTEKQNMLAGRLYRPDDGELVRERDRCRRLLQMFNAETDPAARAPLLDELLGGVGAGAYVQPPFYCDYGYNLSIGEQTFLNFDVVVLDVCPVQIGDHVQVGPGVQLLAADHPHDPQQRRAGLECGAPVTVGDGAWLAGGVIVCPGVTIGADAVVGAGSVVTRDVPARVVAAGNPCRVLREL
jgi:maltose O-acetyltransferase